MSRTAMALTAKVTVRCEKKSKRKALASFCDTLASNSANEEF